MEAESARRHLLGGVLSREDRRQVGRSTRLAGLRPHSQRQLARFEVTSLSTQTRTVDVSAAPSDLVSVEVEVPDDVSISRRYPTAGTRYRTIASVWTTGDEWIRRGETCLLFVPSAVIRGLERSAEPGSSGGASRPAHDRAVHPRSKVARIATWLVRLGPVLRTSAPHPPSHRPTSLRLSSPWTSRLSNGTRTRGRSPKRRSTSARYSASWARRLSRKSPRG